MITIMSNFHVLSHLVNHNVVGIVGIPKGEVIFDNPLTDLVFKSLEVHTGT